MMKRFWLSWVQTTEDYRPLTDPPDAAVLGWCHQITLPGGILRRLSTTTRKLDGSKGKVSRFLC